MNCGWELNVRRLQLTTRWKKMVQARDLSRTRGTNVLPSSPEIQNLSKLADRTDAVPRPRLLASQMGALRTESAPPVSGKQDMAPPESDCMSAPSRTRSLAASATLTRNLPAGLAPPCAKARTNGRTKWRSAPES